MLRREDHLRRHDPSVQKRFEEAENNVNSEWMDVAQEIQEQVCREFGVVEGSQQMAQALRELRVAALKNPELALYVRYNRARMGTLKVGDDCPNVEMFQLDGTKKSLLDAGQEGRLFSIIYKYRGLG